MPDDQDKGQRSDSTGTDDAAVVAAAQNPDAVKAALDRERAAAKEARDEAAKLAKRLKDKEDKDKSETERERDRANTAEAKAQAAEERALRMEVALAKKLPPELAERLKGATQAELEADADELLKLVKGSTPDFDPGAKGRSEAPATMDQRIRRAAGRRA